MSTAARHYEDLLAEHYLWMYGVPFETKVAEQKSLLAHAIALLAPGLDRGVAFDLGSGPGVQSIALAELGFAPVIAIDSSRRLLDELLARRTAHPIEARHADLTTLSALNMPQNASAIVCMGDTLTHLPSKTAVETLFADAHRKLAPGGIFVLTYRDLTGELHGIDRFLPVQADDRKIMTCFLEYVSEESVLVHDLIHVRKESGWELKKSSYQKLRLAPDWVATALSNAGFASVRQEQAGRLLLCVAKK